MVRAMAARRATRNRTRRRLTHVDEAGRARMVDVSAKPATVRVARAEATVVLTREACDLILAGRLPKGDAIAVARIAGIQAAKETARLVPLCHPVALSAVSVAIERAGSRELRICTEVRTSGPTGVEMEAMGAAAVAALTLYDMAKALCRGAEIRSVRLLHKSGGASGTWERPPQARTRSRRS
jgi:cyclic pyranopterin phosphate synthase